MSTRQIEDLRNLGPRMARILAEIGVRSEEDLRSLGAAEAFSRIRATTENRVALNAFYAMRGALTDQDWRSLEPAVKAGLRQSAGE